MIIVYTPCKDKEEAKKIGSYLVEQKIAACANIIKGESIYEWKGKMENSKEAMLILKTTEQNWEKIKEDIKGLHSYDLPAITKINAESTEEFNKWVKDSVE